MRDFDLALGGRCGWARKERKERGGMKRGRKVWLGEGREEEERRIVWVGDRREVEERRKRRKAWTIKEKGKEREELRVGRKVWCWAREERKNRGEREGGKCG